MAIEPVIEIFGYYDGKTILDIRDAVFKNFAASSNSGMIFTYMWDFDSEADRNYVEHIMDIFRPYGTEFYCVELTAPLEVRLARNVTENRLKNKPSKTDIAVSNERIINEKNHRLTSRDGELPFENYLRIDNSRLSAEETALMIKQRFDL